MNTDRLNVDLGESLENTIFSLSQYGKSSLSTGTVWGIIPSYFTNDVPLEVKRQEPIDTPIGFIDTFVLGYDVIVQSNYYISDEYSFPVRALILSPQIIFPEPIELFYYELVSFSNKNSDEIRESYSEIPNIISVEPKSIEVIP